MDYKNNIFILRNIHKSNDEELINYSFKKILPKISNYYKEHRNEIKKCIVLIIVIKIKANYEYLNLNNIRHTHIYLFKNNNISFNETHVDHYSNIVNDEFSIPAIECEDVDFIIFLVNPFYDNSKITLNKNNIEFIYNDFTKIPKTDYNIDNIASNLDKITTNEGNISSNSGKISTNEKNISSNR